jgi:thiamine-phosphate diphosphorylase
MRKFEYCLVTDRSLIQCSLEELALHAETSGIDYFQLREKDMHSDPLLHIAKKIRVLLKKTKFIVNGRVDVALAAGADGVHLQEGNLPIRIVRAAAPGLLIGFSAHSPQELKDAEAQGADYLFLSPVFAPRSKHSELHPIGVDNFIAWSAGIGIPVFALGGISPENLPVLLERGCRAIAGISLFVEHGQFTTRQLV